jgi:hypothetical protein
MEIAIEKEDGRWSVYLEGMSWQGIAATFGKEPVNVYLLVFYSKGQDHWYDDRLKRQEGSLHFCKQSIPAHELMSLLSELELEEPTEARLGNKRWFADRHFLDAYKLTFWSAEELTGFLSRLGSMDGAAAVDAVKAGKPFCTAGLMDDRVACSSYDRFLHRRYNRWHDLVMQEYEEAIKKGEIRPVDQLD